MSDGFDYKKDKVTRNYPLKLEKKMTFAGAFLKYFYIRTDKNGNGFSEDGEYDLQDTEHSESVFSRSINDSTMRRYIDEIVDRIIPEIEPQEMTMDDYTLSYFENVLRIIKAKYNLEDDSSYRRNIRRIYNAWANNQEELTNRIIWPEDEKKFNSKGSIEKRKRRLAKPRSLGIPGEIEIFRWMLSLDNESISKADIGIILMFFLGLRNNEAAGRTFGDIREIQGTKHHCMYVLTSTVGASHEIKVGGKTRNAFRVIPLYDFLYDLLMERRNYVIAKWKENDPKLTEEEISKRIAAQRIASDVFDNTGVSSPDLTKRGKDILTEVLKRCRKSDLSYYDAEYDFRYKLQTMGLEGEDSPTTYLFRRNYATHAVNLGLSASQVEFLIGHEIEEQGVLRHFFNTGEEIAVISEVLQEHPFCLLYRILTGTEEYGKDYMVQTITMENIGKQNAGYIRILANEPLDDISIEIEGTETIAMGIRRRQELPHGYTEDMNIRKMMLSVYKKKAKEYLNASSESESNSSM